MSSDDPLLLHNKDTIEKIYIQELLDQLNQLRKCNLFCDIVINTGPGANFPAHCNVLRAASPYFSCLIKFDASVSQQMVVNLPYISPEVMEIVMEFIYTGNAQLKWDHLSDILMVADYLLLDQLIDKCLNFILLNITKHQVIQIYNVAHSLLHTPLLSICRNIVGRFFSQIADTVEFLSLSENRLAELVTIREIIFPGACNVFYTGKAYENKMIECLKKWENNMPQRQSALESIIEIFRKTIKAENFLDYEEKTYATPFSDYYLLQRPYGVHPDTILFQTNTFITCHDMPPNRWTIKRITFFAIPNWEGIEVLAGVSVSYRHIWKEEERTFSCGLDNNIAYKKHSMELEIDERIVKIIVYHGWMMDGITLYTDKNRTYGPYGGQTGSENTLVIHEQTPLALYLHGFQYINFLTHGVTSFNRIHFIFASLNGVQYAKDFSWSIPPNQSPKCGRRDLVSNTPILSRSFTAIDTLPIDEITDISSIVESRPPNRENNNTAFQNIMSRENEQG